MNRAERRKLQKHMGKELAATADRIIAWHKKYEGVDDKLLEELIANEIKTLSFEKLMLLTSYLENSIGSE